MDAASVAGSRVQPTTAQEWARGLEWTSDAVFVVRPVRDGHGAVTDVTYVYANRAGARLYRRPVEDIVGHRHLDVFASTGDRDGMRDLFTALDLSAPGIRELPSVHDDDTPGTRTLEYVPVEDALLVIVRDITPQRQAEQGQAGTVEQLRAVLDNSLDCICRYGSDLRFEYVNRRVEVVSGIPADQWVGASHTDLGFSAEQAALWERHVRRVFDSGQPDSFSYEIDNTLGHQWWEAGLAPEFDSTGRVAHVISANRDVTRRVAAEGRLRELATRDDLTGLANRVALSEEIERALISSHRTGRPCALLLLDLDRFKLVNNSRGHQVGDMLLTQVAERLRATVRGSDLVGRMGGDEFVVVMRDLDSTGEVTATAQRLVEAFRRPFTVAGEETFTTASIGVMLPQPGQSSRDLLRDADSAMYQAKAEGRDRVAVFDGDLRRQAIRHLQIEGDLRHAIEQDGLEAWYQPEVDLRSRRLVAVEALLRWRHPSGRVLPAADFIDIAEETGLIVPIGDTVLRQACTQARTWSRELDRPIVVRVNFSALQLERPTLLDEVSAALTDTGADPALICAEITETVFLRDTDSIRTNIQGLRQLGFGLAIDDFGTGYASLTYLRRYPVTVLKIDRSFVTSIAVNDKDAHLVAGLVALANEAGVHVTAEGVDTEEQVERLLSLGCPTAQGYLFSLAVPALEIPRLARMPLGLPR